MFDISAMLIHLWLITYHITLIDLLYISLLHIIIIVSLTIYNPGISRSTVVLDEAVRSNTHVCISHNEHACIHAIWKIKSDLIRYV